MKYRVLILLIIVLNAQVGACQKIHFCDTTNEWLDTVYNPVTGTSGWIDFYYTGVTQTYGLKTYYELFCNGDVTGLPDFIEDDIWVREDTVEQKVFVLDVYDGTRFERILYDYTLHQGDTFLNRTFFTSDSLRFVVLRLDTTIIDSVVYKKFTVKQIDSTNHISTNPGWDTVYTYIEGLGTTNGPIFNYGTSSFLPYISKLRCFYNNYSIPPIDSLSYLNDDLTETAYFSNCIALKVSEPVANNKQIQIYPNPGANEVFIKGGINSEIVIDDIAGRTVGRYLAPTETTNIDVSRFVPGVYVVRINASDYRIVKKLIVER